MLVIGASIMGSFVQKAGLVHFLVASLNLILFPASAALPLLVSAHRGRKSPARFACIYALLCLGITGL